MQYFRDARNVECLLGKTSGTEGSFFKREAIYATARSVLGTVLSKPKGTQEVSARHRAIEFHVFLTRFCSCFHSTSPWKYLPFWNGNVYSEPLYIGNM